MKDFDKTEEELKAMNEEELMVYLDEKAAYLKENARPLSAYHTKRFAFIASAISGVEADYEKVKVLAEENEEAGKTLFLEKKKKE